MDMKFLFIVVLLLLSTSVFANHFTNDFVKGEMIIKLKNDIERDLFFKKSRVRSARSINLLNGTIHIVKVGRDKSEHDWKNYLERFSEVEYAEPNYIYSIAKKPHRSKNKSQSESDLNDTHFSKLWGLSNDGTGQYGVKGADISAISGWKITTGDRKIKVAILDTGIDFKHEDLKDNIWVNEQEKNGRPDFDDDGNGYVDDIHGYDFANNDSNPYDDNGHGTHCAGVIGAVHNNKTGVAGVMAHVSLVAIKFLTDTGSGTLENAIRAINYATKLDVDVMSNSWGGFPFSEALKDVIEQAATRDIIFIAAAGNSHNDNDNDKRLYYPAGFNLDNMITVAAHTDADELASFSNFGKKTVHLTAPGHEILSTVPKNKYDSYSGTSMSAPYVAGAVGLLVAHTGRLNHADVKERMIKTATPSEPYRSKVVSNGRLNLYNLLTDTRPYQGELKWVSVKLDLDNIFESLHPHEHELAMSKTFTIPDARYIRAKIEKYDVEPYDQLRIEYPSGRFVQKITGIGENYSSKSLRGDSVKVWFFTDRTVNRWGFKISEVEVVW